MRGLVLRPGDSEGAARLEYLTDLPEPEPASGEVLLRVLACGVNHADRRPSFAGVEGPMPRVVGLEIVGEIIALGVEVQGWSEGERVLVDPSLGGARGLIGITTDGGHAERVTVPAENLHRLPPDLDPELAAALPIAFSSAWHLLQGRARLKGDEIVLIAGASGAFGLAAAQIANLAGCRVLALTSSEWKARELKRLGCAVVFVSRGAADWPRAVLRATGRRGVDLVVDPVGPALWSGFLRVITPGGKLLSCGTLTGETAALSLAELQSREISILGARPGGGADLSRVLSLVSLGQLGPIIDRRLPLESGVEAYDLLDSRGLLGKIVLRP